MSIALDAELEAMVRQKVDTGQYDNADAVIREALEALEERERLQRLRAILDRAEEQADHGEAVEFSDEFLDRLTREADELYRQGKQPHPDVCP